LKYKNIIDQFEVNTLHEPTEDIVGFKRWPDFNDRLRHFEKDLPNLRLASVLGLPQNQVRPLGYLPQYPTVSAFRVTPVVGEVVGDFTPRLQTEEVVSLLRVPLSFLMNPDNQEFSEISFKDEKIEVAEFNYEGHRIWGATAGMILNLYEMVYLSDDTEEE